MKRIGLFFDRGYVDAHSCFTELATHLSRSGYNVDLYCILNPFTPSPIFEDSSIRVFNFPQAKFEQIEFWYKILFTSDRKYNALIGTPIKGAYLAYRIASFFSLPMFYLADELFNPEIKFHKLTNWDKERVKDIRVNQFASGSIALGEERYVLQKRLNKLSNNHKYFIIPNASAGPVNKLQSHYFRDIFRIEDSKPIILFIGTLNWNLAQQVFERTKEYHEKDYHIVFHGRSKGLMGDDQNHPFIHVSRTPLASGLMNYAVSSADAGLVLYDKSIPQELHNGLTGGKIGTYLKNQLPLIAGNLDSFKEVEKKHIGIYWDGEVEIDLVIKKMILNMDELRKNIPKVYEAEYDYRKFFIPFENELKSVIRP